jgi:hypothetical protein
MMDVETDEKFPEGWGDNTSNIDMDDLLDQLICELDGFDLEEMRAERVVRASVQEEAEGYFGLLPDAWPALNWNWDFSAKGQRYVYDGMPPPGFAAAHPAGLRLGWVRVDQFDARLTHFNRRNGLGELWELGSQSKLAEAIAYCRQGHPLTPPGVAPARTENGEVATEVCLVGGNHRYTVAKFSGLANLPIYVDPRLADAVAAIVPVRWADAT